MDSWKDRFFGMGVVFCFIFYIGFVLNGAIKASRPHKKWGASFKESAPLSIRSSNR